MGNLNDDLIQKAIVAARSGNKIEAKKYLADALQNDNRDIRAWYLLSQVIEKYEQKIYCLEKVLEIQPDNLQARQRLQELKELTPQELPEVMQAQPSRTAVIEKKGKSNKLWTWIGALGLVAIICVAIQMTKEGHPPKLVPQWMLKN